MDGSESSLRVVDEGGRGNERAKYVELEGQLLVTINKQVVYISILLLSLQPEVAPLSYSILQSIIVIGSITLVYFSWVVYRNSPR